MNELLVSKGIEPMCGWAWVYAHYHDLDGWRPMIEIERPGARYIIHSNSASVLNKAIKEIVNK